MGLIWCCDISSAALLTVMSGLLVMTVLVLIPDAFMSGSPFEHGFSAAAQSNVVSTTTDLMTRRAVKHYSQQPFQGCCGQPMFVKRHTKLF